VAVQLTVLHRVTVVVQLRVLYRLTVYGSADSTLQIYRGYTAKSTVES
jgi:hypothetical protein